MPTDLYIFLACSKGTDVKSEELKEILSHSVIFCDVVQGEEELLVVANESI